MSPISPPQPVIFLGPSLPRSRAEQFLSADYRPPIRRGEIAAIPASTRVVGIIDGVFEHELAVSPHELAEALARGVEVFGASSMGALRAAEVRGVAGIGRVFSMYASGELVDDDEVALVFDPDSGRALSEPMVNIRHAVARAVSAKQLPGPLARRIIELAKAMPYPERSYRAILARVELSDVRRRELAKLLASFDLKAEDAVALLEAVANCVHARGEDHGPRRAPTQPIRAARSSAPRPSAGTPGQAYVWESGDRATLRTLIEWLALDGALALGEVSPHESAATDTRALERALFQLRATWEWDTAESFAVSLRDYGLELDELLAVTIVAQRRVEASCAKLARAELDALVPWYHELARDDLTLKRALMRLGSIQTLAGCGLASAGPPSAAELTEARTKICARLDVGSWRSAARLLARVGLGGDALDGWVRDIAAARVEARRARARELAPIAALPERCELGAKHDRRFTRSANEARALAGKIAKALELTRVGAIEGLVSSEIHISQSFTNSYRWSTSIAGGKGLSREGAEVGAIMEAAELMLSGQYRACERHRSSAEALAAEGSRFVDPFSLPLPHDHRYTPALELDWAPMRDLASDEIVLVPAALLETERGYNDILYSPRAGFKVISTNGNAAGFGLTEALLHAVLEYVERDQVGLWERLHRNPGVLASPAMRHVDPRSLTGTAALAYQRCVALASEILIIDAGVDLAIPTFVAFLRTPRADGSEDLYDMFTRGGILHMGQASHPDPEVAITSALLEAVQTRAVNAASGREDLEPAARSLGRHERPRPNPRMWRQALGDPDRPRLALDALPHPGLRASTQREELLWVVNQLRAAGIGQVLWADLSVAEIPHVVVVRVVIPELSDTNPFCVVPRARRELVRDWLPPRPAPASRSGESSR